MLGKLLVSMGNDALSLQDHKPLRHRSNAKAGGTTANVPGCRAVCTAAGAADDSKRRDVPSMVRLVD
jgi:hypothetical protein